MRVKVLDLTSCPPSFHSNSNRLTCESLSPFPSSMARNKSQTPLTEAPPEPDSSDDQPSGSSTDVDDADDASSSSSDDEQNQNSKKPTTLEKQSSSSNSDSEPEPEPPVSKFKSAVTTKPRSKPTVAVAALLAEKRPAENTPEKESSKRVRKDKPSPVPGSTEEGSKKLFQRVFSEEDEIAILKGLIDFKERKGGADPMKNDVEFCNFIQKLLHVEVNRVQIVDKVRRLKKKFNNAKKNNKKIINEHEKKMFEMSKKIWEENDNEDDKLKVKIDNVGSSKPVSKSLSVKSSSKGGNDDNGVVAVVSDKKVKKEDEGRKRASMKVVEEDDDGDDDDDEMDDDFKVGEDEAKEGMREEALRKMGAKGRAEIREMWRKVESAQLEVDLMRNAARVEETKRVMEALGLVKR